MGKGVSLSVLSSILFGFLYYYPTLLTPLNGQQVFGWRVIATVVCIAMLISANGHWHLVFALIKRVRTQPLLLIGIPLSATLLSVQMWLFVWAPLHGKALSTSLGYFLLPLVMVVAGKVFYKETFSRFQLWAIIFAAMGVGHEIISLGVFSWDTALVAVGFTLYFMVRRYFKIEGLTGLFSDMLFALPYALFFILDDPKLPTLFTDSPAFILLIPLLGIITTVALFCYLSASRILPLGLFGLLGYVEPVLLFIVALFFLGEHFNPQQLWTYGPIWLAIFLLAGEGFVRYKSKQRRVKN